MIRARGGAVRPNTKAFFGETIGNPAGNVLDIEAVASAAHDHDLPLIVDNTFATPYLCRPIEWGADIVIHSATKFIGGHGTSIGGVVVESGTFDWSNGRFPVIADPSPAYHGLQFHETFGTYGYLMKLRAETLRDLGAALSPFNAFLFLQGLETLSLRMERHVDNALAVASSSTLTSGPRTSPTPACPPALRAARREVPAARRGCRVLIRLSGGRDGGQELIRGVTLWSHLANVGDAKSLIIHPASTTHRQLGDAELAAAGRPARNDQAVGGNRVRRRSDLGPRAGARPGGRDDRARALPGPVGDPARAAQDARRSRSSGCRQTSCAPATSSASTSSATATG
jgi:O-acetylhomoserine (thiol)-lyase